MSERFYSPQPVTNETVTLDGPEAHHLLHVMRAAAGTPITLFDGTGAEFDAVVDSVRRADALVRIIERREVDRELPYPLVVGVALPKGDRQKWLVEKLTELGVTMLVPLVTERGVAQPTDSAAERLGRSVIEASKQCGRNRLMQIAKPQKWSDWIGSDFGLSNRLIAHPAGKPLGNLINSLPAPTVIAVGPEGGFTDEEVAAATAAGWQQVSLGARILRVETAAIAAASYAGIIARRV